MCRMIENAHDIFLRILKFSFKVAGARCGFRTPSTSKMEFFAKIVID